MKPNFNKEKLLDLMRDFHTLTGIRTVIFDGKFERICSYPETDCEFCESMKQNPTARRLCETCDEEACRKCISFDRLSVYECHAGLCEAVYPLRFGGVGLGCIMLGQILTEDKFANHRSELTEYAERFIPEVAPKIERITRKNSEQIKSAVRLMEVCASYLWVSEMIKIDDGGMAFKLTDYIEQNLAEALTVDRLCAHFNVSRNCLYRMSGEYFGMSIAAYIRSRRVAEATTLLKNGCTVAEAAAAVGIDDYNYFSKLYKRETGILPSKVKL